jgi:hypothetical protein
LPEVQLRLRGASAALKRDLCSGRKAGFEVSRVKLLDQMGRELGVGDSIIPKDTGVQNWVISEIEDSRLSAAPGQAPIVKLTFRCQMTVAVPDMGQPGQVVPLYLVRKAEDAPKSRFEA